MIIKIFSTVTVVLVVWLTIQTIDSRQQLASLEHSIGANSVAIKTQADAVMSQMGEFQKVSHELDRGVESRLDEYVALQAENKELGQKAKSQLAAAKKDLATKTKQLEKTDSLALVKDAYRITLEAELLFHSGNGKAAAEKLLTTKKLVWKASGKFPANKDNLRKLMGPIDGLANTWKQSKGKGDASRIKKVLNEVIKKQHAS